MNKLFFILVLVFLFAAYAKSEKKSLVKKYPKLRLVYSQLQKLQKSHKKRIAFSTKNVKDAYKRVALLKSRVEKTKKFLDLTEANIKKQKAIIESQKKSSKKNSKAYKKARLIHERAKKVLIKATRYLRVAQNRLAIAEKKNKRITSKLNSEITQFTKLSKLLGKPSPKCKVVKFGKNCTRKKCCGFKKQRNGRKGKMTWKRACVYKKKVCKK